MEKLRSRRTKGMIQDVWVGKKLMPYLDISDCSICQAVDKDGKPLRLAIDKFSITHTRKEVEEHIKKLGVPLAKLDFVKHFKTHSRYLEEARTKIEAATQKLALSRVDAIAEEYIEADTVIQEIITEGGNMLRRGDMRVDPKLLLGALKEQGARKKMGSLQQMFTDLDKKRFLVGEVVEEVVPPILSETEKQETLNDDAQQTT